MAKKFKVWCDSGANIHSRYQKEIEADIDDSEWEDMSDDEKDAYMKEFALERLEWGYEEIK